MKKICLFVAALCCGVAALAADFRVDNLSYTIIDATNFYVAVDTNYIPSDAVDFVIPSKVTYNTQEYTVTKIATSALQYSGSGLKSITIPATIDTIKGYALAYVSASVINFSEGLKYIGPHVLRGANKITELNFPSTLTSIDGFAFNTNNALHKVTFNSSVTTSLNTFQTNVVDTIVCNATTPATSNTYSFNNAFTTAKVLVPKSEGQTVLNAYKANPYWQNFTYIYEIGDAPKTYHNVTLSIANGSFGTVKVNALTKANGDVCILEEGKAVEFEVLPTAGKEVKTVKLGTNDVTLTDGKFTLPALTQDTAFSVEFASSVYTITMAVEGSAAYFTQQFYYDEYCRLSATLNTGYKDMVIELDGEEVASLSVLRVRGNHNIVVRATRDTPSTAPVAKTAHVSTWNAGGNIFVSSSDKTMSGVQVYDLQGRQIASKNQNSSLYILDNKNLKGYVLRITLEDGSVETLKGM